MMLKAAFALSFLVASSFAAISVPGVCPANGGRLLLTLAGVPSQIGDFLPNVFVYNGNGQPLMSGTPLGPYIKLNEGLDCYFIPNSTLSCGFSLYTDILHTNLIGTGSFFSSSFSVVTVGGVNYFGGGMIVNTVIPTSPYPDVTDQSHINFRSGTFDLHYPPLRMFPEDTTQAVLSNTIKYDNSTAGTFYLWGGNGWTGGADFNPATRTTGFDLVAKFFCPSGEPLIPPENCPPCSTASSNFLFSSACPSAVTPVHHHSSSTCITLTMTQSSVATGCQD